MSRLPTFFILYALLIIGTPAWSQDSANTKRTVGFQIGIFTGLEDFEQLNQNEKSLDSVFQSIDSISKKDKQISFVNLPGFGFKNNRARINVPSGNKNLSIQEEGISPITAACECTLKKDTLQIKIPVGFFWRFYVYN